MISLIHPSRSRPKLAYERFKEWTGNASTDIQYILSLDTNDNQLQTYRDLFKDECTILVNQNRSLVDATNAGAKIASGDLFVVVSDDFHCFPDWDSVILKATKGRQDFLLKTFDGKEKWICTLPILDRIYYMRFGWIYNPIYLHMFVDTEMTHIADASRKMIIRNDIVFKHDNPSINNDRRLIDDLHRRNNATFRRGSVTYKKRVSDRFGLGLNVLNLSPEGNEMLKWLKMNR